VLSDALSIAIDPDWERRIRDAARNRDDLTRRISEDEESGGSESNLALRRRILDQLLQEVNTVREELEGFRQACLDAGIPNWSETHEARTLDSLARPPRWVCSL